MLNQRWMRGLKLKESRDVNGVLGLYGMSLRAHASHLLESAHKLGMRRYAEANMKQYAQTCWKDGHPNLFLTKKFLDRLHLQLVQRQIHLQTRHELLEQTM